MYNQVVSINLTYGCCVGIVKAAPETSATNDASREQSNCLFVRGDLC